MKAVLDTNIIISGIISPNNPPWQVLSSVREKRFELCISKFIIDEATDKLITKLGFSHATASQALAELTKSGKITKPKKSIKIIKEKDSDNRILECALAAKADYLVSGDKKHILPLKKIGKTKIVSAKEFLDILFIT